MKKILTALFVAAVLAVSSFAVDSSSSSTPIWDHGDNVSEYSYRNVGVYRMVQDICTTQAWLPPQAGWNGNIHDCSLQERRLLQGFPYCKPKALWSGMGRSRSARKNGNYKLRKSWHWVLIWKFNFSHKIKRKTKALFCVFRLDFFINNGLP